MIIISRWLDPSGFNQWKPSNKTDVIVDA
jgi:hypothetical protein